MRAAFHRPGASDIIGCALWRGGHDGVLVDAVDDPTRDAIRSVYRPVPVVVDDASLRSPGTLGPVVLSPGSLRWFRAASEIRSAAAGLAVRLVPEAIGGTGWDPAGAYRTFMETVEQKERAAPDGDAALHGAA